MQNFRVKWQAERENMSAEGTSERERERDGQGRLLAFQFFFSECIAAKLNIARAFQTIYLYWESCTVCTVYRMQFYCTVRMKIAT